MFAPSLSSYPRNSLLRCAEFLNFGEIQLINLKSHIHDFKK